VTATSPEDKDRFGFARASSNMCGCTLMNSQTGNVVADVMRRKERVTVTELPSMIRVDAIDHCEFNYDEIAEELGVDTFETSDLEEVLSTHYGRMVRLDDRTLLFANPEDAAQYLGFDLVAVR
jgi:propane monooxygenase coupling protein